MRRETHWHGGNRAELFIDSIVELNVGEAFDASVTVAGPLPLCVPFRGRSIDETRALRTGACSRLAPKIVQ